MNISKISYATPNAILLLDMIESKIEEMIIESIKKDKLRHWSNIELTGFDPSSEDLDTLEELVYLQWSDIFKNRTPRIYLSISDNSMPKYNLIDPYEIEIELKWPIKELRIAQKENNIYIEQKSNMSTETRDVIKITTDTNPVSSFDLLCKIDKVCPEKRLARTFDEKHITWSNIADKIEEIEIIIKYKQLTTGE